MAGYHRAIGQPGHADDRGRGVDVLAFARLVRDVQADQLARPRKPRHGRSPEQLVGAFALCDSDIGAAQRESTDPARRGDSRGGTAIEVSHEIEHGDGPGAIHPLRGQGVEHQVGRLGRTSALHLPVHREAIARGSLRPCEWRQHRQVARAPGCGAHMSQRADGSVTHGVKLIWRRTLSDNRSGR